MPKQVRESTGVLEAATTATSPRRRNIQIITPGWGSSGYYSAEVLEQAAKDKVIPSGTHMYLNHASESEMHDRPEREVEKIAAVLVEDATWDGTRLIAAADLIGPHAELIEALAPYIGVSICGSATDIVVGEAEGRTGPIIEGLAHVSSVDFVTHAGRGGMVLLESARPSLVNALAVEHGVAEATANDTREQLQAVLRDTFGGEKSWVWVRDFDDTTVWYEHETPDSSATYALAYETTEDGVVSLSGSPTEVRARTEYVPVARPGSTTTTESQEDTMPQIEEARLRQLEEDAGRVPTLTAERDAAVVERDAARAENAALRRGIRASEVVAEVAEAEGATFDALQVAGLVAGAPVTESGELDEEKFRTLVEGHAKKAKERAAQAAVAAGAGVVTGFGTDPGTQSEGITESEYHTRLGIVKGA